MAQCVVLMGISIEGVPADHMTSQIKQRFPLPVRQECFCQSQRRGVPSYVLPPLLKPLLMDAGWLQDMYEVRSCFLQRLPKPDEGAADQGTILSALWAVWRHPTDSNGLRERDQGHRLRCKHQLKLCGPMTGRRLTLCCATGV